MPSAGIVDAREEPRVERRAVARRASLRASVAATELIDVLRLHVLRERELLIGLAVEEDRALVMARIAVDRVAVGQLHLRDEGVPHERGVRLARGRRRVVALVVTPRAPHAERARE